MRPTAGGPDAPANLCRDKNLHLTSRQPRTLRPPIRRAGSSCGNILSKSYFARGKASGMNSTTRYVPGELDPALAGSLPAAPVAEEEFFSGRGGIYH